MPRPKESTSSRLFRALDKILSNKLPNHTKKLVIELEINCEPIITATYYPEISKELLVTEQFELKKIGEEKEG